MSVSTSIAGPAAAAPFRSENALGRVLARVAAGDPQPLWHSDWAWANYEPVALALIREFGLKRAVEIGGGRDPAFLPHARALGFELVVNDIDANELALLPPETPTALFNVAGDLSARRDLAGAFDFVTARMVMEHVDGVPAAWRNIYRLLSPGGVGLAFFPTLYAWPFLVNHLLPDRLAKRIVETLYPARRQDGDNPVFPALYDHCVGSETKWRGLLEPIGFSEVHVQPFWGHRYLEKVPLIRTAEEAMNRAFAAVDLRLFTTYAYVIVRK